MHRRERCRPRGRNPVETKENSSVSHHARANFGFGSCLTSRLDRAKRVRNLETWSDARERERGSAENVWRGFRVGSEGFEVGDRKEN